MSSITRIATRFGNEICEIQRQVNFLKCKCTVQVDEIHQLNQILAQNGMDQIPARDYLGLPPHNLTFEEIRALSNAFDTIVPKVDRKQNDLIRRLDDIPARIETADATAVTSWVDYILEGELTGEETPEEIKELQNHSEREWLSACGIESEYSTAERRGILDDAYKEGMRWRLNQRVDRLQRILDRAEEIRVVASSAEPNATMGTFRQGFIAMMAAFDAAIFDLVRLALKKRFFELVGVFGNDRITMEELADLGSVKAVREAIIETQLKKRYVKELLSLLQREWKVEWLNEPNDDRYPRLIEVVLRRNLHLHNRGLVDQRYLDSKKNLYKLKLGDAALIDEAYWQYAKGLCMECVQHVTIWANAD